MQESSRSCAGCSPELGAAQAFCRSDGKPSIVHSYLGIQLSPEKEQLLRYTARGRNFGGVKKQSQKVDCMIPFM